ncbi:hypothetical protein [Streptomyces virginiae]|uniref:hypothetical protein n=1 Tax=Streptomyces virginiae TaxID=1961 RepID=UPI0032543285
MTRKTYALVITALMVMAVAHTCIAARFATEAARTGSLAPLIPAACFLGLSITAQVVAFAVVHSVRNARNENAAAPPPPATPQDT